MAAQSEVNTFLALWQQVLFQRVLRAMFWHRIRDSVLLLRMKTRVDSSSLLKGNLIEKEWKKRQD